MNFSDFYAGNDDQDRRLDKIIRKMIPENNISSLYSAIRKGLIKVNDKKQDINYKIKAGDKVSIASFLISEQKNQTSSEPANSIHKEIETIFSNDYIRIINKPYDISVHGDNGLSEIIESMYKNEKHEDSLAFKTGPLHRLDRKTTGLLAFSNNQEGAKWFTKAISDKTIKKYYIGIVQGKIINCQEWTDNLIASDSNDSFYTMKVSTANSENRAITICIPLAYGNFQKNDVTLCQFQILTGKKHQIRCQSSFHGYPLLGDTAYGGIKLHEKQDMYLHAYRLMIPHDNPIGLPSELTAPVSHNFNKFLSDLLIKWDCKLIIN